MREKALLLYLFCICDDNPSIDGGSGLSNTVKMLMIETPACAGRLMHVSRAGTMRKWAIALHRREELFVRHNDDVSH